MPKAMSATRPFVILAGAILLTAGVCDDSPTEAEVASKLSVATAPSSSPQNRVVFATQPVIQLQSADNENVAKSGVVVTAAITSGGGTLGGTTTATTDADGKAAFSGLMITGTAGAHVITFTAPELTSTTASVTLTAGAASAMTVSAGNNQSAVVGTAVTTAPAVLVADADANPVSGVAVTFAVASGGGSVAGGSTTTNASGVATVGSWTLGSSVGANTLTASSTGLTSVTFTATATANPNAPVNFSFCGAFTPLWFAYQNGTTGTWTQLAAKTDGTFDVPITSVGGIAFVSQNFQGSGVTSSYSLGIIYATKTELGNIGCPFDPDALGTKTINGTVANVSASQFAQVSFGSAGTGIGGGTNTFQLTGAPDGARDLIASRATSSESGFLPDRFIVRRSQNPANNSTLAVLDFGGSESVAPATASFTLSNVGTEEWSIGTDMRTANGTTGFLGFSTGTGTGSNVVSSYQVLGASQRISTDNFAIFAGAFSASGGERGVNINGLTSFSARTVTLGPTLNSPTVTQASTTPSLRMRTTLVSQSQYGGGFETSYYQEAAAERDAFVFMTSGYLGGTPATWDVTMPDLSGAGFQATWGLQAGTPVYWDIFAHSGIPVGTGEISTLFGSRHLEPPPPAARGSRMLRLPRSRTIFR